MWRAKTFLSPNRFVLFIFSLLALSFAAQAIDVLLTDIPLGREERVDAALPGRVSLARAFPPRVVLDHLLDSPYPNVRASALRVVCSRR